MCTIPAYYYTKWTSTKDDIDIPITQIKLANGLTPYINCNIIYTFLEQKANHLLTRYFAPR